mmetsp:Transcript_17047/g.55771  ORF Transcript_17047/g.55771 Transcript_17047/m.55771 type:complete len:187 (+) Transcript_17047:2-562(+)
MFAADVSVFGVPQRERRLKHSNTRKALREPPRVFQRPRRPLPTPRTSPADNVSLDLPSGFEFFKIEALIRPWRLNYVVEALDREGIRALTVSNVQGLGVQQGDTERYKGQECAELATVDKTKIEVVVIASQAQDVVRIITDSAATGEIGDGKIFVMPIVDIIRVRTGEQGPAAERMVGGRQDLLDK